jgi:PLP dependent protein
LQTIFLILIHTENYHTIKKELDQQHVQLIAVSKTKPVAAIQELYDVGQRDFGENYVQELVDKHEQLPKDIRWHFIGHLQSNKVKYIAPFVHLIHSVDSEKLLSEIQKQALKNNRIVNCLLQIHIAQEETKFGFDEEACEAAVQNAAAYPNVHIEGLMGMASFTDDVEQLRKEFVTIQQLRSRLQLQTLSTGMSSDYKIAIQNGSTMVRIGSLLFGKR